MVKLQLINVSVLLLMFSLQADTLVLKNGLTLEGKYKGGTETTIKFETSGAVQEVATAEIKSLTFSAPAEKAASEGAAAPALAAAAVGTPVASGTQIPAGTKIMIRTKEAISTASHQQGSKFTCELEADLNVDGKVVAPKGTPVYGTVLESIGGRRVGMQRIVVSFDKINLNNQLVAMVTDDVGAEGGRGGAARAVGAGALIGAAAGDAGAGAAVGAGLALLAGGKHIQVPAETIVEVSIKQSITVP
ncbi:MAG: hypothetical protein JSW33_14075 [bacterium]|nr:MAG: hypothetical protein JSW33_14075 [bacterium]